VLTEQQMIRSRYRQLMPGQMVAGDPRAAQAWNDLEESRYYVAPPYYQRLIERNRMISIADSMAQGRLVLPTPDSSFNADSPVLGSQGDSTGMQGDTTLATPPTPAGPAPH
jgi:hypothetical protein